MLVACAFAVESAAIAENPIPVRQEVPEVSNVEPQAQQPEGHQRDKKWAGEYLSLNYVSKMYDKIPYTFVLSESKVWRRVAMINLRKKKTNIVRLNSWRVIVFGCVDG